MDENHETMSVIEVYGAALGLRQLKNKSRIGSTDVGAVTGSEARRGKRARPAARSNRLRYTFI